MNILQSEDLSLHHNFQIAVFEKGELVSVFSTHNKIPLSGRNAVRDFLGGSGFEPTHIGVGTNGATPADGDTAGLSGEVFRKEITTRVASSSKITYQLFIAETEANGFTLTDARLCNSQFASQGDLYARAVYTPVVKSASISVTLTWDINLTS